MTDLAKGSAPWSVKGVDRGARDAAREAAQAAGLTIGQWIDRAILRQAGLVEMPRSGAAPSATMRDAASHVAAAFAPNAPRPSVAEHDPRMVELTRQVDAAERHMSDQLLPVGKAVEALARRLVDVEAKRRDETGHPTVPEYPEPPEPDDYAAEPQTPSPGDFAGLLAQTEGLAGRTPPPVDDLAADRAATRRSLREKDREPVEPVEPPPEVIDFESRMKLGSEARVYRRTRIAPEEEEESRPRRRWGRGLLLGLVSLLLFAGLGTAGWLGYQASQRPNIELADIPDQMVVEAQELWGTTLKPGLAALQHEIASLPLPDFSDLHVPAWLSDLLGLAHDAPETMTATPPPPAMPAPTSPTPTSPGMPAVPTAPPPVAATPPVASDTPPAPAPNAPLVPPPVAAPPVAAPVMAPSTTPQPQALARSAGSSAPTPPATNSNMASAPAGRPAPAAPDVARRSPAAPQGAAPAAPSVSLPSGTAPAAPAADADPAARLAWLENMAKQGDAKAQHDLAILYAKGEGVPQDFTRAAYWFREAAVQNVPNAQYNLGVLYETGLGVAKDEVRALLWYHTAAELNHPNAQYNFGIYFLDGRGGISKNAKEAVRWLRRAADQGVARALFVLGKIYEEGREDIEPNLQEAVQFYTRAADRGYAEARVELARLGRAVTDTAAAPRNARATDPNSVPAAPAPVAAGTAPSTLRSPAATAAPAPTAARETVAAIQQFLLQLNLNPGPPDGFIGPRTTNAIKRYQETNGLPADGLPSEALLRHLSQNAQPKS